MNPSVHSSFCGTCNYLGLLSMMYHGCNRGAKDVNIFITWRKTEHCELDIVIAGFLSSIAIPRSSYPVSSIFLQYYKGSTSMYKLDVSRSATSFGQILFKISVSGHYGLPGWQASATFTLSKPQAGNLFAFCFRVICNTSYVSL